MSALGDVIVDALKGFLRDVFGPVQTLVEKHGDGLLEVVVGTPNPNSVFSKPTNQVWPELYDFHWDTMVPLTLSLWALAIGLVIFLESTSHLFSSYHRSKLKKRAFTALIGILMWWWVAAIALRFVNVLTGFLVPPLSDVTLFETVTFTGMGVLGLVLALLTDLTLFVLIAVIYLLRQIVLYLFVLLMPLLIVFWVPAVGPFSLVSRFMRRLAGFFTPFLFMTVPVALLFRLGELLGDSVSLSIGGIGAWITGVIVPIVAVTSPFFLFWQAGAIFFAAERAANHLSAQRARRRVSRGTDAAQHGTHGGRNFLRGTRGKPAVRPDGQTVLDSGNSRAHATGSRLNAAGTSLRSRLSRDAGPPPNSQTGIAAEHKRRKNFEALRGRTSDSGSNSSRPYVDDDPRYLQ